MLYLLTCLESNFLGIICKVGLLIRMSLGWKYAMLVFIYLIFDVKLIIF